ncbi:contractile injection system protein, VgrG/Pvc8 family [Xanthomonas oryzae pv. oryzicola]|uniref:contractile injection system protein, VgrG/Pvc8 family n=1 Tax=Xanthomonas oryzae TaxID=347 RepID=UPI003DA03708
MPEYARAICERIFADYPQAAFRFDVQAALPAHPITTQYRETDWAFVTRLLAEAGLAWPGATRTRRTPTARPPRPRW